MRPTSEVHATRLVPADQVPRLAVPAPDVVAAEREDVERRAQGLPERFAIPRAVRVTPDTDGIWEELDGDSVWRVRVGSPGAVSLNLGFTRYAMPEGGRLIVHAQRSGKMIRPFTASDNAAHGELWTPPLDGDELVVEVTLPTAEKNALGLELTRVNVGYRPFGSAAVDSGSCNNDVVCPVGAPWQDEISAAAMYAVDGFLTCSGAMINNTAQDQTPYFLTAYHCGVTAGNAASLIVFWNFETSTCGGTPDGSLADFQTGAFFRAAYSASDFTLVELDSNPDFEFGVTFAGWDRSGADASSAVGIHHPNLDEKRISFDSGPTTTTSYLQNSSPGDGSHVRVGQWEDGTTEGGSSGSPLFDQNHRIIGQLHGGTASCTSLTPDWYGRFAWSWSGGGSNATRLSNWLDPGGTGAVTVDTLVPANPALRVQDLVVDDGAGNGNGVAEPGETIVLPIEVVNFGAAPATGVSGTLSTADPLVTVLDGQATWPDIPNPLAALSDAPHFTVEIDPDFSCGNAIVFQLDHAASEFPGSWVSLFALGTGTNSGPVPGFSDDMESGTGSWTTQTLAGANPWALSTSRSSSPTHSWFVADVSGIADSVLVSPVVDNPLTLRFALWLDSEVGYDGAVLEYSTDGGTSWNDTDLLPTNVPYNVIISTEYGSPLAGRAAWSGATGGFLNVVVDLSVLSGSSVRLRWRFASDSSVPAVGMNVDDVAFDVTTVDCEAALLAPGEVSPPGSVPFTINPDPGGYALAWVPPTSGGSVAEYFLYSTPVATPGAAAVCEGSLGSGTAVVVATLPDDSAFLVGARNAGGDGPFGHARPPAALPCP